MERSDRLRAVAHKPNFFNNVVSLIIYAPERRELVTGFKTRKFAELDPLQPGDHACLLRAEDAQALMDSLWDCGVRPTQGSGSAGSFEAQRPHLEDVRQLLFHTMSVQKP